MKSFRFRFLVAGLAVLLGTMIARGQSTDTPAPRPVHAHGWGHGDMMMAFMTKKLNLTDTQQGQIKSIMQKERPTMKPLMQQMHQTETQLRQYEQGAYDEAKVRALATQQAQIQTELTVQRTRIHNEMFQVLTTDQQNQMKAFQAEHEARMAKHMSKAPAAPEE